ncbi:MAG: hypothetical protein MI757_06965 [Pirellulales bacterium]|nr:hypothetical protein [Pirellulales bacterium]
MRRIALSLIVGVATFAAVAAFSPQQAKAEWGYGYGGFGGGYGYRGSVYRPYPSVYRPYRYNGFYRGGAVYIPPSIGPSPYGWRGMIGPRPVVMNPGIFYRY